MDLQTIKTKSGKTIQDFQIPEQMLEEHPDIVEMVLLSESMDDGERQYWFNLYNSMEESHIERLRGILTRERERRAEIEAKYAQGAPAKPEMSAEEVAQRNEAYEAAQKEQWAEIKAKEAKVKEQDAEEGEDILGELDNI